MYKIFITYLSLIIFTSIAMGQQSVTPSNNNEYCPDVNYTFTVTVPGNSPSISASGGCAIIFGVSNLVTNSSNTSSTFNFTGRFNDVNAKQTFIISYSVPNSPNASYPIEFKKIKSLFFSNTPPASTINSNPLTINIPICQIVTQNISFPNIQFYTEFESPAFTFGTITTYEYLLPAGWSINVNGTITLSDGSTWIAGNNNVNVTSDATSIGNGYIAIRPTNACGPNLSKNYIKYIPIDRAVPEYAISPANITLTCGINNPIIFTINQSGPNIGTPTYTWNLGNNNGWVYQGATAPSTINTGTSNTLTLTPACGLVPKPFNVTVNVACITKTTTTLGINREFSNTARLLASNYTIYTQNQRPLVCASYPTTFTMVDYPCDATISWYVDPSSSVNFSSLTGASVNAIASTSSFIGEVMLTATINSPSCGNTQRTIPILVGGRDRNVGNFSQPYNYFTPLPFQTYTVFPAMSPNVPIDIQIDGSNPTFTNFYKNGGGFVQWNYLSSNVVRIYTSPGNTYVGQVSAGYECGRQISNIFYMQMGGNAFRSSNNEFSNFELSPNPAVSFTMVGISTRTKERNNTKANIDMIEIYDKMGLLKNSIRFAKGTQQARVDVSNLVSDTYILRVFNGITWEEHKLLVMK